MASILQVSGKWRAQVRKGGKSAAKTFATEAEARDWAASVEALYEDKRPISVGWRQIAHHELPRTPIAKTTGIYFLFKEGVCVYVGKSANVYTRIETHFRQKGFDEWAWVWVPVEELDEAERHFIKTLKPALNRTHNRPPRGMNLSTTARKAA